MEHTHNHYNNISSKNDNNFLLALSATLHCLLGCGLGEVAGMIISVPLMLDNNSTMILSIVLGIIGGFGLGIFPKGRLQMESCILTGLNC